MVTLIPKVSHFILCSFKFVSLRSEQTPAGDFNFGILSFYITDSANMLLLRVSSTLDQILNAAAVAISDAFDVPYVSWASLVDYSLHP